MINNNSTNQAQEILLALQKFILPIAQATIDVANYFHISFSQEVLKTANNVSAKGEVAESQPENGDTPTLSPR